jgi:hypothetical protein
VTKFSARTGNPISYLTAQQPGGGPSDPQLVGDRVYYLSGSGTCANSIQSVPVTGGTPTTVATPDPGYVIRGYSADDPKVNTFFETACDSATAPAARLVVTTAIDDTHQSTKSTAFDSVPPGVVSDPSWDSDRHHFDAILRTGTRSNLVRYDASAQPKTPDDNVRACSGYDLNAGEPQAIEVDASGNLWFAVRTGSSMQVVRCIGDTPRVMFTVAGNRQPADVDVAGSGTAVLLTDTNGSVWRWSDGAVTQLKPSVPLTQLTW